MSPYDPSRLIRKQVLRIFYPPKADLPDQKVYTEFDADGEIMAMRDEIRILREALEEIIEMAEDYALDFATRMGNYYKEDQQVNFDSIVKARAALAKEAKHE